MCDSSGTSGTASKVKFPVASPLANSNASGVAAAGEEEAQSPRVVELPLEEVLRNVNRGRALTCASGGARYRASKVMSEPGFYILTRREEEAAGLSADGEGLLAQSFSELIYLMDLNAPLKDWVVGDLP